MDQPQKEHGKPNAIVIGAGPAGLLTAHALQMGIKVTVYEQDAGIDARPRDWNFGIYWAQVPLQECLPESLAREVENAQVDDYRAGADETMPIYNGLTGDLLKEVPIPYNIRLGRKKFIRLISQGVEVKYGKRLKAVSSNDRYATACFDDGTTASGDLLVGADSAHSVVRDFLLGPDKARLEPLPLITSAVMARLPEGAAMQFKEFAHRLMVIFHPAGYFNWIGLHDACEGSQAGDWTFMMIMSWVSSDPDYDAARLQGADILADIKARAAKFDARIRFLWESIPNDTKCWHTRLSYWIPEGWNNHNGTVTMVGDAAHPMTFHRGQGLNNAINDVATLARELKTKGFGAAAVNAYEESMIPRAREAVITSNDNSMSTHDWSKLLQSPLFTTGLKQK